MKSTLTNENKKMDTIILADLEIKRSLRYAFKVSNNTVNDALNGKTQSDLARRIRKRALDLGGAEKGTETVKML
jgi:hypothetical protein